MSIRNVFPAGSSVLDQYVISTRGTAQFGDNSNNYLVGVAPTTYNTYQVATVGNINNFGTTPQNNTGSRTGTYYSNGVSAMRIPVDSSANRPPNAYAGYIRYNANNNYVEYYNSNTSNWLPISQQSPVITNVTPSYISQDTSYNVYSITGSNFNINTSISFLGVNNSNSYTSTTSFSSSTLLTSNASYVFSDVSANPSGYYVVATNQDTGLSFQYGTIITFNSAPIWSTPSSSLGVSYSNLTFTTANSPFTSLVATDPNTPITYYYSTPPVGTTITLDASTGILIGTTPIVTSTTTYNFYAIAKDGLAVPAISVPRLFSFTIASTMATITGSAIYSVGYTDANGQNYSATTPISGGYTVYWFTAASSATFTTSAYTPTYITYLVVGGGGGGGGGDSLGSGGGGGGAGGVLTGILATSTSTGYTVTVGTGGAGGIGANSGGQGSDTTFGSIIAYGGGGGGNKFVIGSYGNGSGGGGGLRNNAAGGIVNTPTNPPQGNAGGNALLTNVSSTGRGGGGGGVMMAGVNGSGNNANAYNATGTSGGTGGNGMNFTMVQGTTIPGAATGYGGGGGGGAYDRPAGLTYIGGGGAGVLQTGSTSTLNGNPATANTGGGGGGASTGGSAGTSIGGTGSQGFILLRHLTIPLGSPTLASYTISPSGYTISYVNNANVVVGSATLGGYTIISFPAASLVNQIIPTTSNGSAYTAASSSTQTYTFTPTSTMGPVAHLIVGGGGGGGCRFGAGGGAGGIVYGYATLTNGTAYTISVGAGGAGASSDTTSGVAGTNSSFSSSGGLTKTAYGGGGGGSERTNATTGTIGSGGGGSYAEGISLPLSSYANPGIGTGGQGFNGGYGNNSVGVGRNGGGGGGVGGPGGAGSTTIGYASGTASNPETQLDSYAYGAPYGGQAIGLSITGTLTAYGGGGGGCDMRQDSGNSMGYGGGGGINYTSSSSLGLGYPSGTYFGVGYYGVYNNSNSNVSGGRGGGSNGRSIEGASGSCLNSSGVGEAGRHGTGGGGGGGSYIAEGVVYTTNPNPIPGGQPGGAGGSGIVILRFPSYIC